VADSVADGVIPEEQGEDLVIVCGVFIHPAAEDNQKIYEYNYQATKDAIASAMNGTPTAADMVAGKDAAAHPFKGF
jgi:5,6,7,8-tetrahydromethanopterin hydro-lyase